MKTYYQAIEELADDFIEDYRDEIKEIITKNKEKTDDEIWDEIYQNWDLLDKIWEFLDSAWHGFLRSDWCKDRKTELGAATKILEENKEVERDSGLWEGKEPTDAIVAQAFATAKNDLYFELENRIRELIKNRK
ncbi:hypothetical protein J7L36_02390 [bacterium]|nr:hypothetical protein [bacterium]